MFSMKQYEYMMYAVKWIALITAIETIAPGQWNHFPVRLSSRPQSTTARVSHTYHRLIFENFTVWNDSLQFAIFKIYVTMTVKLP